MTYYRLALQARQSSTWTWKSTGLTSLNAVLQLLRIYSCIPQDHLRVFTSSSKEGLDELLSRENNNTASGSVTAAQFLRDRHMYTRESVQSTSALRTADTTTRSSTPVATYSSSPENSTAPSLSDESGSSSLDKKRLELERGTGGDHDTPYLFSLPISTPQLLAWTRLLARAQAGELES